MFKQIFAISIIVVLLTTALIFSGCAGKAQTGVPGFESISVQEAADLIKANESNPDFIILDVRTPEEFNAGHIQNAINLDYYAANFRIELDKLDKENTYLVYCRTGMRSGEAMKIMESLGFKEVYNLSAGISDWISSGFPTTH